MANPAGPISRLPEHLNQLHKPGRTGIPAASCQRSCCHHVAAADGAGAKPLAAGAKPVAAAAGEEMVPLLCQPTNYFFSFPPIPK